MPTLGTNPATTTTEANLTNTGLLMFASIAASNVTEAGTLDSIHALMADIGSDDYELVLYQGGTDTDPSGASLIAASGTLDGDSIGANGS